MKIDGKYFEVLLLGIVALLLYMVFIYIPLHIYPAEDATILFQYSENLAQSGSISYNLYDQHSEGATDFLWMVLLALFKFLGFDVYISATVVSLVSLILTAYILFKISNIKNIYIFVMFILLLLSLPMIPAAIEGFSILFFGLFISLSAYFFIIGNGKYLFISALFLSLIRPDGIIVALSLSSFHLLFNRDNVKSEMNLFFRYFVLPGVLYFLWRWYYFGEFLPLPFYVKSNFERYYIFFHKWSLYENRYIIKLFLPLVFISFYLFFKSKTKKYHIILSLYISLVIVPFLFYSSMMLSQNISFRFQYSMVLGIIIIFGYSMRYTLLNRYEKLFVLILLCLQLYIIYPVSKYKYMKLFKIPQENIIYISKELNSILPRGVIATTEAGRLAYYSKWFTIDTWGLNTPEYSKRLIKPDDISKINPDIIVVHGGNSKDEYKELFDTLKDAPVYTKRTWYNQTVNILKGIDRDRYSAFMVPFFTTKEGRYDLFFIKNNAKNSKKVERLLLKYGSKRLDEYLYNEKRD